MPGEIKVFIQGVGLTEREGISKSGSRGGGRSGTASVDCTIGTVSGADDALPDGPARPLLTPATSVVTPAEVCTPNRGLVPNRRTPRTYPKLVQTNLRIEKERISKVKGDK
ncbi:UNVERIFIED_CONTAM: hypothetical protein PYX00_002837 [Menopon gallinae]|uniref:Uncharacterized protein n=1 Tax=Menopon gallinae TaxID=328185 RepID=A0AAW2HZ60_9NEOP